MEDLNVNEEYLTTLFNSYLIQAKYLTHVDRMNNSGRKKIDIIEMILINLATKYVSGNVFEDYLVAYAKTIESKQSHEITNAMVRNNKLIMEAVVNCIPESPVKFNLLALMLINVFEYHGFNPNSFKDTVGELDGSTIEYILLTYTGRPMGEDLKFEVILLARQLEEMMDNARILPRASKTSSTSKEHLVALVTANRFNIETYGSIDLPFSSGTIYPLQHLVPKVLPVEEVEFAQARQELFNFIGVYEYKAIKELEDTSSLNNLIASLRISQLQNKYPKYDYSEYIKGTELHKVRLFKQSRVIKEMRKMYDNYGDYTKSILGDPPKPSLLSRLFSKGDEEESFNEIP